MNKMTRSAGTDAGKRGRYNKPVFVQPEKNAYPDVGSAAERLRNRKMDADRADNENYGKGSPIYGRARQSGFSMQYDWLKNQIDSGR